MRSGFLLLGPLPSACPPTLPLAVVEGFPSRRNAGPLALPFAVVEEAMPLAADVAAYPESTGHAFGRWGKRGLSSSASAPLGESVSKFSGGRGPALGHDAKFRDDPRGVG